MGSGYRVCVALWALVGAGCARPEPAAVDDPASVGGSASGDGGSARDGGDPSDGGGSDGGARCGDHVCSAGEACTSCPEDCGACPGCPPGRADCDRDPGNGCEVDLSSPQHCGACGRVCLAAGGANACVPSGATWSCRPSCDATHADCDGDPTNGCETDLQSPQSCGACAVSCANPHGTIACGGSGSAAVCTPGCSAGWAACGSAAAGCTTNVSTNPDACGSCGRACSAAGASARACSNGACTPSCAAPRSDCSHPAAPAADDGCETDGTADPGELDNRCASPQSLTLAEGSITSASQSRILPIGDVDTWHVRLVEGSHDCVPLASQSFDMRIDLAPPSGSDLRLAYNLNSCDDSWSVGFTTSICVSWSGTCGTDDSRDYYFQVYGFGTSNSCSDYRLTVTFATEGNLVTGCN